MPRKLLKFIIIFDNTSLLYFPGQFLSGRVLLELQDDTPALGLHFHVVGEGVVRVRSARQERTYDRENFIDFRMRLLGDNGGENGGGGGGATDYETRSSSSGRHQQQHQQQQATGGRRQGAPASTGGDVAAANGGGSVAAASLSYGGGGGATVLSPGIHSFPFKLGLPLGLPSTFLGRYGWIQYYCKAALREPNGLIHKNHQVFIVMNPIDLNLEQSALAQPFRCDIEHRLGVSCVGGGLVRCRVALDRGGYVPGESITITAHVQNGSNVTVRGTKAALTETIQYLARGRQVQQERRQLAVIARGKIRPGGHDEWRNEQLYVPPLPPTNLRGCHLIKIQYDVFFIIEPKSIEKPIKLQLPIVLATYPFRSERGALGGALGAAASSTDVAHTWPESILKPDTHYPSTLPIFRPWLHDKPDTS